MKEEYKIDFDYIIHRLSGCHALLASLCESAEHSETLPAALDVVDDILVDTIADLKCWINNTEEATA